MRGIVLILLYLIGVCNAGRSCLSCSGIEGVGSCSHHITCGNNEVCYMHHYTTESGQDNYDFGCSTKQICPTSTGIFVGKRAEGRHSLCYQCCNNTELCNAHLQCTSVTTPSTGGLPRECSDIKTKTSGVHTIYPFGVQERPVQVACEFDTNGRSWTVIQKRVNGYVNFSRDWESYKQGFGSPDSEYWIGNEAIHALTSNHHHELMMNMSDFDSKEAYARYNTFHVGDEADGYSLYVNGYSGTAGDDLTYSSGSKFSTFDRDNDKSPRTHCAKEFKSGWWFNSCMQCNLNGEFLYGHHTKLWHGVYWDHFKGYNYSLRSSMMMIRKL